MPRSRAIWPTVASLLSPSMAAHTMLCGLVDPRDLVRMSVTPAQSSTPRTAPPAIPPVPDRAGLSPTLAGPAPAHDLARDGAALAGRAPHRPPGGTRRLGARLGALVRLAGRDAHAAFAVAHRHQRVEGEPPAALHHLGHAVDGDHVLLH